MTGKHAPRLLYLVSEDWYFCSHRLPVARAAIAAGFEVHAAVRVGEHRAQIENEGIQVHPIAMRRAESRVWREGPLLASLALLYARLQPTVAHHVAVKPVLYGTLASTLAPRSVVVNALAGLGYLFTSAEGRESTAARVVRSALPRLLGRTRQRVVVQNRDDAGELTGLGVPAERIRVIRGSGVDPQRFAPTPEPAGVPVAVLAARLLRDKGIEELVAAARLLAARKVPVRIEVVGAPDAENPASIDAATLADWRREGLVTFHGHRDDMERVWREAHIAVLPSWREGLPKTLLEAAASGRPMVATDVTGCREVVEEDRTGLLVPVRDPGALADAIETLARDGAMRSRMGLAARALVEREFTEEHVQNATIALYRELMAEHAR